MTVNDALYARILAARDRVGEVSADTPQMYWRQMSARLRAHIWVLPLSKMPTGSFKVLGPFNKMTQLTEDECQRGVVAASAGNHAQGVALAAVRLCIRATIFMPVNTPQVKVDGTRRHGGRWVTVVLAGDDFDESCAAAWSHQRQTGKVFVHPFDDLDVIAGAGTAGLTLHKKRPSVQRIICAVGGGGLVSGIGTAVRHRVPDLVLNGVNAEGAPAMQMALAAGRPVTVMGPRTAAGGASVGRVGDLTFELASKLGVRTSLVSERDIVRGMVLLRQETGLLAERTGAMPVAALLSPLHKEIQRGETIVLVISGGNVSEQEYAQAAELLRPVTAAA